MPYKYKEKQKEYEQRPEVKERIKEYKKKYNKRPEVIARRKIYDQKPERKEYHKKYREEHKEEIIEYNQRPEVIARIKEYYQRPENKEKKRKWNENSHKKAKEYRKNLRRQVINHYSNGENKCKHCGLTDLPNLTIDHINGGGTEHRKKVGSGTKFYRWLIKNSFPEGYQVLCFGCNLKKGDRLK